jgi:hypothetical protein
MGLCAASPAYQHRGKALSVADLKLALELCEQESAVLDDGTVASIADLNISAQFHEATNDELPLPPELIDLVLEYYQAIPVISCYSAHMNMFYDLSAAVPSPLPITISKHFNEIPMRSSFLPDLRLYNRDIDDEYNLRIFKTNQPESNLKEVSMKLSLSKAKLFNETHAQKIAAIKQKYYLRDDSDRLSKLTAINPLPNGYLAASFNSFLYLWSISAQSFPANPVEPSLVLPIPFEFLTATRDSDCIVPLDSRHFALFISSAPSNLPMLRPGYTAMLVYSIRDKKLASFAYISEYHRIHNEPLALSNGKLILTLHHSVCASSIFEFLWGDATPCAEVAPTHMPLGIIQHKVVRLPSANLAAVLNNPRIRMFALPSFGQYGLLDGYNAYIYNDKHELLIKEDFQKYIIPTSIASNNSNTAFILFPYWSFLHNFYSEERSNELHSGHIQQYEAKRVKESAYINNIYKVSKDSAAKYEAEEESQQSKNRQLLPHYLLGVLQRNNSNDAKCPTAIYLYCLKRKKLLAQCIIPAPTNAGNVSPLQVADHLIHFQDI